MDNEVMELIDQLYTMVSEAWGVPLGNEKCIVERDQVLEILDEIKTAMPVELSEAKRLVSARDEFINNAKREAEGIRNQAEERARALVDDQEIVRIAKARSNEMLASTQAKADALRRASSQFCDEALRRTEEAISAALVLRTLLREQSSIRLIPRELHMHWPMLGKIIRVGIPAALQLAVTAFSNIFVQSYINYFGADCMSGWTAYNKIDQLMFLPMQSVALAATTFVGQNLGIGNVERAKKGVRSALLISMVTTAILMAPVLLFAPDLTAFFNAKPEVIRYGTLLLRWLSPFYILCCVNQVYAGALRGAGNSQVPMILMLSSFVVFRQCYLYVMSHFICNEVLPIALSYPAGWIVCSVATLLYYRRAALGRRRLVEDN